MVLESYLEKISILKKEMDDFGKLQPNVLQRIHNKFRLEWNYHSNSLEGNSLTKEETQSVMLNEITIEGKPLKDVLEIRGHDEALRKIQQMASGEISITENKIKEIHTGIMSEPDSEKQNQIGHWKKIPNYLYNYRNERIDFTAPENVAKEMNTLINWLNNELTSFEKGKSKLSIVEIAAELHLRYVTIHPFYDGNGRTARILMNLVLIRYGYPPIIVKVNEKTQYGQYLAHAQEYEKNPQQFYEMMASLLIRSMELYIKAAKGEDITESDDFEKELQQIELKLKNEQAEVIKKSHELVVSTYENSIKPLTQAMYEKLIKFNTFFTEFELSVFNGSSGQSGNKEMHDQLLQKAIADENCRDINITYRWKGFNRAGNDHFDVTADLRIEFEDFDYKINRDRNGSENKLTYKKLYSQQLTQQEITKLVDYTANTILSYMKEQYKRLTGKEL